MKRPGCSTRGRPQSSPSAGGVAADGGVGTPQHSGHPAGPNCFGSAVVRSVALPHARRRSVPTRGSGSSGLPVGTDAGGGGRLEVGDRGGSAGLLPRLLVARAGASYAFV